MSSEKDKVLIQRGSLKDLLYIPASYDKESRTFGKHATLRTASYDKESIISGSEATEKYLVSRSPRGITLKSIKLTKKFDGIFSKKNQVFFIAWSWDLSGEPPFQYPGIGATPESCLIPMTVNKYRHFLGKGILLFPSRIVTAGICIRIMLWESDQETCDFGETLSNVTDTINKSDLKDVLSLIKTGQEVATAAILAASAVIAKTIGEILKKNNPDRIDFFEGYYPVSKSEEWVPGDEINKAESSEIILTMLD